MFTVDEPQFYGRIARELGRYGEDKAVIFTRIDKQTRTVPRKVRIGGLHVRNDPNRIGNRG